MRQLSHPLALVFSGLLLASAMACSRQILLGQWTIQSPPTTPADLAWARFTWSTETLSGRAVARTTMVVPATLEGLPQPCSFQLDLGSNLTLLQGNVLKALLTKRPDLNRLVQPNVFKDLTLSFGGTNATTPYCYVKQNYGEASSINGLLATQPLRLGTIGADLFQHKILVIDYPHQRFAVCDTLPTSLHPAFTNMTLDVGGRVILPLDLNEQTYNVLFDTGSSLFPLLTAADKIDRFSTARSTDTLAISSWGTTHTVVGRPLTNQFRLAGQAFSHILIYADYRPEAKATGYDAIAGNALFWEKTVVIDFKHHRFGVQ